MNLTLYDIISQLGILVFGVPAVWLMSQSESRKRRWGVILGCCSQPFWFMSISIDWQHLGILGLCFLYTCAWVHGVWLMWFKPKIRPEKDAAQDPTNRS